MRCLQHREAVARLLLVAVGLLDALRGTHAAAGQLALALRLHLEIGQPVLGFLRVGPGLAQAHLELLDRGARGVDLGLGLGERQPVGLGIEPHQHVAGRHDRVVAHAHLDDAARHFAGDLRDVRLDEGVLGRGVAAALQPEHQRADEHQRRHADQREWRGKPSWRHAPVVAMCPALAARARDARRRSVAVPSTTAMRFFFTRASSPRQLRAFLRGEIGERVVDGRLGDAPDAPVHALGFRREIDALDAPVAVLRAALDPAIRFEPVDHPSGARPLDLHHVGELGLRGARMAVQPCQHQPLGARDAERCAPGGRTPCATGGRRPRSRRR